MTETTRDADVAFIQALAEVLKANDLTELHVKRDYGESDSLNVRVSRVTPAPAAAPAAGAERGADRRGSRPTTPEARGS